VSAKAPLDLLAVFAHPDDEVLCAAGTLALCVKRGGRAALICATRGELGPIADPALATRSNLAAVREQELRASCRALGLPPPRFLDLPDAEVAWAAEAKGTLAQLVSVIRRERPRAVITFGPDGLYGHADHVAIGELVERAVRAAGDPETARERAVRSVAAPRLFQAVMTGNKVMQLMAAASQAGRPFALWTLRPEDFYVTAEAITCEVDVTPVLPQKLAALRCHRTQLDQQNVLAHLTPELARSFFGTEAFHAVDGGPGGPI
jgi:N-acetyl-1-D-myo-inositol-2-amino-2-deoxy-alpha-D-glucopyranoside deacetylase